MTRLRVATIGAGYFSQFHYDAWGRLPVDVVGVCDLDAGRATAIAAGFPGARAFADATQMLEQTSPELLDVIVPPAAQEPVRTPGGASTGSPSRYEDRARSVLLALPEWLTVSCGDS